MTESAQVLEWEDLGVSPSSIQTYFLFFRIHVHYSEGDTDPSWTVGRMSIFSVKGNWNTNREPAPGVGMGVRVEIKLITEALVCA